MKPILDLNFGYSDAGNYQKRANKELFNKIFVKDYSLDKLLSPDTSFLIGEKGTGKTAYSVYLANNYYKNTIAQLKFIRETEYEKFYQIKRDKNLLISDYIDIWKVILLLLLAKEITKDQVDALPFSKSGKIKALWEAVDEFYNKAFSPEIIQAIKSIDDSRRFATIIAKYLKIGGHSSSVNEISESKYQINLLYIQKMFEKAINDIKLKDDHLLFIDGIDIRPGKIPYNEYLECIKGLVFATMDLNDGFFANIKDSKGRLRVVLLLRPDIFNSLNLQNSTNKLKDNSVYLDWRTTYRDYRNSQLFYVVDRVLSSQQDQEVELGKAWDNYFRWNAPDMIHDFGANSSFISFLRYSYSRPRDILSAMQILQEVINEKRLNGKMCFDDSDFNNKKFRNRFSSYIMGGIKDQLSFYYNEHDYGAFVEFFNFLNGQRSFSYDQYCEAYDRFGEYVCDHLQEVPEFVETKERFLQFLFDTNIICYIEKADFEEFFRWCYRERSMANIAPKVRLNAEYKIHNALEKALNVGGQKVKKYYNK